jgi:hypothetical protein
MQMTWFVIQGARTQPLPGRQSDSGIPQLVDLDVDQIGRLTITGTVLLFEHAKAPGHRPHRFGLCGVGAVLKLPSNPSVYPKRIATKIEHCDHYQSLGVARIVDPKGKPFRQCAIVPVLFLMNARVIPEGVNIGDETAAKIVPETW